MPNKIQPNSREDALLTAQKAGIIRAIILGVSDYSQLQAGNLPFCTNDIKAVEKAFVKGLNVSPLNIEVYGKKGTVLNDEFICALDKLSKISNDNDTILFYFSGHGVSMSTGHHLVLSDEYIKTQDIIKRMEEISAKNKIIILDCCNAGDFHINNTAIFNINDTANEFSGKGYAVIASSNASQSSYNHPENSLSLFTSFLCWALNGTHLIKEGKKSLYDIKKLLFMYLEVWNKNNPDRIQTPIFRANMGGTIFFDVKKYTPYNVGQFYEETDTYIIYSVEPTHHGTAKRFRVQAILKTPSSFEEISLIKHEIVDKIKFAKIYNNKITEKLWRRKPANLVSCFFGLDEEDVLNNNYFCITTWADETQDRDWWYRIYKNTEIINDIHFKYRTNYQFQKTYISERIGTTEDLVAKTKSLIREMVTLAEQIIIQYSEFANGEKSERELAEAISKLTPDIKRIYSEQGNLDIAPKELKEWSECCMCLSGTIHDFTFYYNQKAIAERTPENRKACMDMSIEQYYKDFEHYKKLEEEILLKSQIY